MQQVPIEQVLEEFRKKYNKRSAGDDEPIALPKSERPVIPPKEARPVTPQKAERPVAPSKPPEMPHPAGEAGTPLAVTSPKEKKRSDFLGAVAVQGATAAVILFLILTVRLINPELYEYIAEFLRARL